MEKVSANLRFILWQRLTPREEWIEVVSGWLNCDHQHALALLSGGRPSQKEMHQFADALSVSEEELVFEDFLANGQVDLLAANLTELLAGAPRGTKKALASRLGVHPTSISRWLSGVQAPERDTLTRIAKYFGLVTADVLLRDALFLELAPVSRSGRMDWAHKALGRMSDSEFNRLFPALWKLLG